MIRRMKWYYVAALGISACHGILLLAVQFLAKRGLEISATPGQIGTIPFIGAGCYVIGSLFIAPYADRHGRKPFMVFGALIFSLCFGAMSQATEIWHIYLLMIPQGLACGGFWPAVEAGLADEAPVGRLSAALGLFNISWSVGEICGNVTGGVSFDMSPQLPFYIVLGLGVAISILLQLFVKDRPPHGEPAGEHGGHGEVGEAPDEDRPRPAMARAFFRAALVANFASIGSVMIVRGFIVEIANELQYTGTESSVILAITFFCQGVAFLVLGRTTFWHYKLWPLQLAQAGLAGACLFSAFTDSYVGLVTAASVAGACVAVPYASSIYYGLHGSGSRAKASGMHEAILGLGASLLPFLGGRAAELSGFPRAAYVFAPFVLVTAAAAQVVILIRARAASPGSS